MIAFQLENGKIFNLDSIIEVPESSETREGIWLNNGKYLHVSPSDLVKIRARIGSFQSDTSADKKT